MQAEETHIVFAAVLCAYEQARARIDAERAASLDREIARVRGFFRGADVEPLPCSNPFVGRLAGCIRVWTEASEILGEWRSDGECSSADVARYK